MKHRVEHVLLRMVAAVLRGTPEPLALRVGSALGWFVGSVLRIRRRVVEENLGLAFPEWPPARRRRTAAAAFRHIGREAVAFLLMADMAPSEVRDRVEVEGLATVKEALAEGRGVLLLTGHVGNWEAGGAGLAARGIPIHVLARRQNNPLFEGSLSQSRERLGLRVIYRDEGVRPILRALGRGDPVALVADQNVRRAGLFVDFFGSPASTARGPALVARRTGARVVFGVAFRQAGRRARYRLLLRPLEVPDGGDPETDERRLLQAYVGAVEEAAREAPEQYFWPHRRWKTRPGDIPEP
jgi:Kdo2-lipid IVA lauroyltransferase/acyltransferase